METDKDCLGCDAFSTNHGDICTKTINQGAMEMGQNQKWIGWPQASRGLKQQEHRVWAKHFDKHLACDGT